MSQLEEYLQIALPWDGEEAQTFKSVSHVWTPQNPTPGQKVPMAQAAAQSFDELVRLVRSRAAMATDVYISLGTQREAQLEQTRDGFFKANRKSANIVSRKQLVIDVDVGKDGGYADTNEAWLDFERFRTEAQMPEPTLVVFSGTGGFHVYWVTHHPMDMNSWRATSHALANATRVLKLKCDAQVTVNPTLVLRPPETQNYKHVRAGTGGPLPVQMMKPGPLYDYDYLRGCLQRFAGPTLVSPSIVGGALGQGPVLPQGPGASNRNGNFGAGVGPIQAAPIPLEDVAENCPAIAHTLDTKGATDNEPLWQLMVYAATFDPDPDWAVEAVSEDHPAYDPAVALNKLREKQAYRAQQGGGWPSCASFSHVSPKCQACPLLAQNKTPFHFVNKATGAPSAAAAVDLPERYWRSPDGTILTSTRNARDEETIMPVLDYAISAGRLRTDNGALVFKAHVGQKEVYVEIERSQTVRPADCAGALASFGVMVKGPQQAGAKEFIVAWMAKLQTMKTARIDPVHLGWDDDFKSFTYGEFVHSASPPAQAFYVEESAVVLYKPKGERKYWDAASAFITGQKRPALDTILATAFAAPLVHLMGMPGVLVSAFSQETGIGKSTAMRVAQAVWGDPIRGMNGVDDTTNSVITKISHLRHLPLMWDELKMQEDIEKFVKMVFRLGQGKEKSRLDRNAKAREIGTFSTMMVAASNDSIAEHMIAATSTTGAGIARVFEFTVPPMPSSTSIVSVSTMIAQLDTNYGHAGEVYAAFLGANGKLVRSYVEQTMAKLETETGAQGGERFWISTMAALLVGAGIAKHLGLAQIDIPAMRAFLVDTLKNLRTLRVENVKDLSGQGQFTPEDLLNSLLKDGNGRFVIVTNKVWQGVGKPAGINLDVATDRVQAPWVQYGAEDGLLRIIWADFQEWLRKRNYSSGTVLKQLELKMGAVKGQRAFAVGTHLNRSMPGRYTCVDVQMPGVVPPAAPMYTPAPIPTNPSANPGSP